MNEPKIRFKGGCGEWNEVKLTDIATLYNGLTYNPSNICERGTLVLRSSNVQNGEISLADNVYVEPSVVNTPNVKRGDIIVVVRNGSRALIGKHAQIKEDMPNTVIGAFMAGMRSETPEFINALLGSPRFDYEVEINLGATINQITNSTFRAMVFGVPSNKEEQKAIGNFFTSLDAQISASTSRLASLKQMKAASLQAMFPQEGETVPKVRFKGFQGEWKKVKLSDVSIVNPKSELPESFEYVDLESVVGTSMVSHRRELRDSAPSRAQRLAQTDDIFYQTVRPYQRNNYHFMKNEDDYVFSSGYAQLRAIKDANFLFTVIQSDFFLKQVIDNCTGSSFPAINPSSLKELIVHDCDKNEQKMIGDFFTSLDRQITLQSQRLEKLKQIKAACLDKMFV